MQPIRLYIKNFMCLSYGFIDFTLFNSALIVGKKDGNDHYSNGVGKSSIFKAIEYVIFNQTDINLEKIILDDSDYCSVVLDFMIGNQEFRLSRKRSKKGNSDLTLLQRNAQSGSDTEVYHLLVDGEYEAHLDKNKTEKYWKNLSGSRSGDTEKELDKLIKFNHKSFRSTVHFMQNDMTGLPTVSSEKRKAILKDALNLIIYTKLEKIVKEKFSLLTKEAEKIKTLIDSLGFPETEIQEAEKHLLEVKNILLIKENNLIILNDQIAQCNNQINQLSLNCSNLELGLSSLLSQESITLDAKNKLELSIKEYQNKKNDIIKVAKTIITEINDLKLTQDKLSKIDFSQIDVFNAQIEKKKEEVILYSSDIKNYTNKYEELKIPLPNESVCKHCRQSMSNEHKNECQKHIDEEIKVLQFNIQNAKKSVIKTNNELSENQKTLLSLQNNKQQLESLNNKISLKGKEVQEKNNLHNEYLSSLDRLNQELNNKNIELTNLREELKKSSLQEIELLKQQIIAKKQNLSDLMNKSSLLIKEITHYNNNQAVLQHNLEQKNKDKNKKIELEKNLVELENKLSKLPIVIQGFSSSGMPNLIIQDVLDDLQLEANKLLNLLKPGLQLSFLIEKTKGNGEIDDTLDIIYCLNGKERYYEQLSGAMKLSIVFSLKLGLSFLLKKRIGIDLKFLLLDEIDQSLDKASIDAFADIVKFFQQDFTILIITHNDRLKDKFNHLIMVEQNHNMVSKVKFLS